MVLSRMLRSVVAFGALVLWATPVSAQIPERFTNLQVLPKDITRADLVGTMRGWARELGVRCHNCHVGPDNLQGMDFATDDKPTKRAAREMLRMVRHVNGSALGSLPPRDGGRDTVTCYTCHRRQSRPPLPLAEELLRAVQTRGAAAGVERYRELRRAGETAGTYDFTPETLSFSVFNLFEKGLPEGALALAQLGVELSSASADAHAVLGEVQRRRGDASAARESFRKALERDPRHALAQRALKELDSSPPSEPSPR